MKFTQTEIIIIISLFLVFVSICIMLAVRFEKITRERARKIVVEGLKFAIGITIIRYIIKWISGN
jgi:hypothetical protein